MQFVIIFNTILAKKKLKYNCKRETRVFFAYFQSIVGQMWVHI